MDPEPLHITDTRTRQPEEESEVPEVGRGSASTAAAATGVVPSRQELEVGVSKERKPGTWTLRPFTSPILGQESPRKSLKSRRSEEEVRRQRLQPPVWSPVAGARGGGLQGEKARHMDPAARQPDQYSTDTDQDMTRLTISFLIIASLVTIHDATDVKKCKGSKVDAPKKEDVSISNCEKPPCRLRHRTSPNITMKVIPDKDADGVITQVSAEIANVPVPFIGVDGTSACGNFYSEDGKTKVGCPLKAGTTYTYKNSFNILNIYPRIKLNIHWGLVNNKTREHIVCFEVPARIG